LAALSSTKKSNGLMVAMSATRSTVAVSSRVSPGTTTRARKLPNGSCCQLMKCGFGVMRSE
jgi:hypothetical protein